MIVRINTDEGISGFGEVGLAYGKGWRAGYGMVQDFAEVILGEDPMRIEKLWDTIFRNSFWGMGGGTIVNAAISAIDIALWDIKGKALGVPVWQLLGGKTNDNLRTYASQLQFNWGTHLTKQMLITPEEYAEVTRSAMADGYNAIKVDPLLRGAYIGDLGGDDLAAHLSEGGTRLFLGGAMGALASAPWVLGVVTKILSGVLADKFNRRAPLLLLAMVGVATGVFFGAQVSDNTTSAIILAFGIGAIGFGGPAAWTLMQDIVPSKGCATAAGVMNGVGNGLAALAPISIGALISLAGNYAAGLFYLVGICVVGALATLILTIKKY